MWLEFGRLASRFVLYQELKDDSLFSKICARIRKEPERPSFHGTERISKTFFSITKSVVLSRSEWKSISTLFKGEQRSFKDFVVTFCSYNLSAFLYSIPCVTQKTRTYRFLQQLHLLKLLLPKLSERIARKHEKLWPWWINISGRLFCQRLVLKSKRIWNNTQ